MQGTGPAGMQQDKIIHANAPYEMPCIIFVKNGKSVWFCANNAMFPVDRNAAFMIPWEPVE